MINTILNKYINNEKSVEYADYSLNGISTLLELMGNPQNEFKSVHIAGTNGKGSTSFMLALILENSGYNTGLYTSPHLERINERIKINSNEISDKNFHDILFLIDSIIQSCKIGNITYFDIITAAAFKYFSDNSVDIAVIETGLGGRLDSTNVVFPEISILTDISIDHISVLGNSISEITREKCGIIKKNVPVITSNTDPDILKIIEEYSDNNNSQLIRYNVDFFAKDINRIDDRFIFEYSYMDLKLKKVGIRLFPIHQIKNASVVITAIKLLQKKFLKITNNIIYKTLSNLNVPGRFEKLSLNSSQIIIFDPAHNYNALNNLIEGINSNFRGRDIIYIVSLMKDKADLETLNLLKKLNLIYLILDDERGYIPGHDIFTNITTFGERLYDLLDRKRTDNSIIIITGTFRIYKYAKLIAEKYFNKDNNTGKNYEK